MKAPRFLLFLLASTMIAAPSREIVELQRDVASVQDMVRTLQRTLDEKLATLNTLVQQSLDTSNKSGNSLAVLESGLRDRMAEQQKSLIVPVTNVSAKIDQMSTDFQVLRESVLDLTDRMSKLQTQLVDLNNTVKVLNAPPAAPPPLGSAATGDSAAPPQGVSAKQLYDSALRDRSGGNLDLALQGFQEFIKYFGTTELAPNAQFYIGQIHYDKSEFPAALQAFDTVLERYSENNKTADAAYMKGMTLLKAGQRNEAAKEFLNVIQKYPNSEVSTKARAQRKALGLSVPAAATSSVKRRR